MAERVERNYFPDRFGFEIFGDPFEGKREMEAEKARNAPPVPNAEDIPAGSYKDSCNGCALSSDGKALTCTQCKHWSQQSRNWNLQESTIALQPPLCQPEEWIGNRDGMLACEPKPESVLAAEQEAVGGDGAGEKEL